MSVFDTQAADVDKRRRVSGFSGCRVGRVKIMRFSSLCQFLLGVAVAFSGNYYLFVVLRFLLAMVSGVFQEIFQFMNISYHQNKPSLSVSTGFFRGGLYVI